MFRLGERSRELSRHWMSSLPFKSVTALLFMLLCSLLFCFSTPQTHNPNETAPFFFVTHSCRRSIPSWFALQVGSRAFAVYLHFFFFWTLYLIDQITLAKSVCYTKWNTVCETPVVSSLLPKKEMCLPTAVKKNFVTLCTYRVDTALVTSSAKKVCSEVLHFANSATSRCTVC